MAGTILLWPNGMVVAKPDVLEEAAVEEGIDRESGFGVLKSKVNLVTVSYGVACKTVRAIVVA